MHIQFKKTLPFLAFAFATSGCEDANEFIYNNPVTAKDVKMIILRADHHTLLPDGKATMKFYAEAYNTLEFPDYTPTYVEDSAIYIPHYVRDNYLIPSDQLPEGLLHLVDETGKEYPDFTFSTTDTQAETHKFHIEAGEIESNEVEIQIRSLPAKSYEEIEIPVIFHILNPAERPSIAPIEITPETVYKNIERLNNVFNGKVTTDPNGGNAHITFRPAVYGPNGIALETPGVHYHVVPLSYNLEKDADFQNYVWDKKGELIYNYQYYLNIWLINNPKGSSSIVKAPTVIDNPENPIPGLEAKALPASFPTNALDVGFFVSMSDFLNPFQNADYYEISNTMGIYLGLLSSEARERSGVSNIVNGDTDYCKDTFLWWTDNTSVFKSTARTDGKQDGEVWFFTSYHVMDRYSYKNSITADQAERIRLHLERCPSRWMYKRKFALTGRNDDK